MSLNRHEHIFDIFRDPLELPYTVNRFVLLRCRCGTRRWEPCGYAEVEALVRGVRQAALLAQTAAGILHRACSQQ